jgi:preprotein translocase subunit Sec63
VESVVSGFSDAFSFSAKVFSMALVFFPSPFQSRSSEKKEERNKKQEKRKKEKITLRTSVEGLRTIFAVFV